jgi:hypothetical protein
MGCSGKRRKRGSRADDPFASPAGEAGCFGLAVADIVSEFAACGVESRLILAQFRATRAYFFQVVADLAPSLKDLFLAGAIANIPTQLEAVFAQLGVVFAKIRAAFLNFSARVSDISEVALYFGIVLDAAIVKPPVPATVESAVAAKIVATVVATIEARVAPIIVAIMSRVAVVAAVVIVALVAGVATVVMALAAVKMLRLAMTAPVIVLAHMIIPAAVVVRVGARRQQRYQH